MVLIPNGSLLEEMEEEICGELGNPCSPCHHHQPDFIYLAALRLDKTTMTSIVKSHYIGGSE